MQTTDKQTIESHSKHTVLCIQIVKSTIADQAAKKTFENLCQNHQQTNSRIFFELGQQLAIVQISAALAHVTRYTPFLHHWNAVINNSDKF